MDQDIILIGIMIAVGAGCWLVGAAGGHYAGYKTGYRDAVRARDGVWKDRLALTTKDVERRMLAAYNAGVDSTAQTPKDHDRG